MSEQSSALWDRHGPLVVVTVIVLGALVLGIADGGEAMHAAPHAEMTAIEDGFEDGAWEDDWQVEKQQSEAEAEIIPDPDDPDNHILEIRTGSTYSSDLRISRPLTHEITETTSFGIWAMSSTDGQNHGYSLRASDGGSYAAISKSAFGHIMYNTDQMTEAETLVPDADAVPDTWYRYTIIVDPEGYASFFAENGETGEAFSATDIAMLPGVDTVVLGDADYNGNNEAWFDDIGVDVPRASDPGSSDTGPDGGGGDAGADEGGVSSPPTRRWTTSLPGSGSGTIATGDEAVFLVTGGQLHAVNRASGEVLWRWPRNYDPAGESVPEPYVDLDSRHNPVYTDGVVYIGVERGSPEGAWAGVMFALDAASGETVWRFEGSDGAFLSPVAIEDGTVFALSTTGHLYAIDRSDGSLLWDQACEGECSGGDGELGLAVASGLVVYGTGEGDILAVDAETGETAWSYTVDDGRTVMPPAISGASVAAITEPGLAVGLELSTGEELWTREVEGYWAGPPISAREGRVFIPGIWADTFHALDARSGETLWTYPARIEGPPEVLPELLVLGETKEASLLGLTPSGGWKTWLVNLTGPVEMPPTASDGELFVFTEASALEAFTIPASADLPEERSEQTPDQGDSDSSSGAEEAEAPSSIDPSLGLSPSYRASSARTGSSGTGSGDVGDPSWTYTPSDGDLDAEMAPVAGPDGIYVLDCTGEGSELILRKIEAKEGREGWTHPVDRMTFGPATDNSRVYVADRGGIHALSPKSGEVQWTRELERAAAPFVPAVSDGTVFVPAEGSVYALDTEEGATRWSTTFSDRRVYSSPAVSSDGLVFVATLGEENGQHRGTLHALQTSDGGKRWSEGAQDGLLTPTIGPQHVFVLTFGGNLLAFDRASGEVVWEVSASDSEYDMPRTVVPPIYAEGTVYLATNREHAPQRPTATYLALDAATGELRWERTFEDHEGSFSTGPPALAGDVLYGVVARVESFAAQEGHLVLLGVDPETGQTVYERVLATSDQRRDQNACIEGPPHAPTIAHGHLYVATDENLLALPLGDGREQAPAPSEGWRDQESEIPSGLLPVIGSVIGAALVTGRGLGARGTHNSSRHPGGNGGPSEPSGGREPVEPSNLAEGAGHSDLPARPDDTKPRPSRGRDQRRF